MKKNPVEFLKWCNTPMYRPANQLGYDLRVKAQFPNYDTYLVIDDKGKNALGENVYLTADQLYNYWVNLPNKEKESLTDFDIKLLETVFDHKIQFVKRSKIKEQYISKYDVVVGDFICYKTTERYTPVTLGGFDEEQERDIVYVTTK